MSEPLPVLELPTGLTVSTHTQLSTDFASIKVLVESGVPISEIARKFKVSPQLISRQAKKESWLTPSKVESLRKEIVKRQGEVFQRSGKAADVNTIKAEIWTERADRLKEKTYEIVSKALEGVTEEQAKKLIKNPLGLAHITTVARQITGEEQREQEQPKVAVNIAFLRSGRPTPVVQSESAVEV